MEIKSYNENKGWEARNLNGLIQRIHDNLTQDGVVFSDVLTLFNMSFKIKKDRPADIMNAQVIDRDGERGLNFLKQEWREWVAEEYHNPGEAWKEYPERWKSFLNVFGEMDYSYHERINNQGQIGVAVRALINHPHTRRAYISIYDPVIDSQAIDSDRMIPCILGYQFTQVNQDLNMTVMARSIDANNCLINDIWLADKLLDHIVEEINRKVEYKADRKVSAGSITFMISNLHSYPDIVRKEMTK